MPALFRHPTVFLAWQADSSGGRHWLSAAWLAFAGRTLEQEQGAGWVERVHPNDRDRLAAAYRNAVAAQQLFEACYRVRHYTGEYRWIHDIGIPLKQRGEQPSGYIGLCFDSGGDAPCIGQAHSPGIDSLFLGYALADEGGCCRWSNSRFCEATGYGEGELRGKTFLDLIHPDDRSAYGGYVDRVSRGELSGFVAEVRVVRKDGTVWLGSVTVHAVPDAPGCSLWVIGRSGDPPDIPHVAVSGRESEVRWQFSLDGSGDGVWDLNVQSGELFMSPRWKVMLGYSADGPSPQWKAWLAHVHPADVSLAKAQIPSEGHSGGQCEIRVKIRDGSYRWIVSRWKVLSWTPEGAPLRVGGTYTDITVLKRLLQSLAESQVQFSQAFRHAPIGIALVDIDGRWLQVNAALCQTLLYSEDELLRMRFQDVTHPDDLLLDAVRVVQLLKGECTAYEIEKRYVRKDGVVVWAQLNVSLVADGQGRPAYFIAQMQDITARKTAEERLRQSERQFSSFMDNLHGFAWIKGQAGAYQYVNQKWAEVLTGGGGQEFSVIGKTDAEMLPSACGQARERSDRRVVRTQRATQTVEQFNNGKADATLLVSRFPLYHEAGQPFDVGGVALDITERVRMEDALKKSRTRASRLLEEREHMSRDLHDNSIQMLYAVGMELYECQALVGSPGGAKKTQPILERSAERINSVIRELRQYLVRRGGLPVKTPDEVLGEIRYLISQAGSSSKMVFEANLTLDAVKALDRLQVSHVIAILRESISNVLRHSRAKNVRIALTLLPASINLEVADDGVGMRVRSLHTQRDKHGLRNIKARAKSMKGRCAILAGPGKGTVIRLSIPRLLRQATR